MKKLKLLKRLINQKGFSLVELMVVVAIIGILASIAIPSYQKFQRRSMQVEPKTNMSGLYAAQITFSSEWNGLTADFRQLGFTVANQESARYITGWTTGSDTPKAPKDGGTDNWYYGPPPGDPVVVHLEPSQCVVTARCDNTSLDNAFDIASFDKGDSADCTRCIGTDPRKADGTACIPGTPNPASCAQFWDDGKLDKRENQLRFVIGSSGDIGGGQADIWHMSFNKKLTLVQDGVN